MKRDRQREEDRDYREYVFDTRLAFHGLCLMAVGAVALVLGLALYARVG